MTNEPNICLYLGLIILGVSTITIFYPWRFDTTFLQVLAHLPLMNIALYACYEIMMPETINIRADILYLWPMLFISFIVYVIKLVKIRKYNKHKKI